MRLGKKIVLGMVCVLILWSSALARKSVFIISSHDYSHAQAYSIEGTQVVYQADVDISGYNQGYGACGIAVWPEKNLMFVTYEESEMIVWASTKTLEKVGDFETELGNLAGIVVDSDKELIYVMERDSVNLYLYSFDESGNKLVLEGTWHLNPTPGYYIYGMGLALDENRNLLYVTSLYSNRVHIYDTGDFIESGGDVDPNGYIDIVVGGTPPEREAVGIAVDPVRRFMYTAGFYGTGGYHNYLVRTQLDPPYNSIEVLVDNGYYGVPAVGIDVDKDTGYVYVTTQVYDFRVYDSNLNLLDVEQNPDIYTAAGVAVGGWYKAPAHHLVKDNADPNNDCVEPENYLVFDIYWDANGHPDTNVVVVDQLPDELDYDSSIPEENDYNEFDKTVKWNVGNINAGSWGHIVLKTKVNYWARPCDTITNTVIMEGDTYLNEARCDVNVCPWGSEIIYVDWDAPGYNNGTSWDDAYTDLQDALAAARRCGPAVTAIWVAAGTYKPVKDINQPNYQNQSFELPNGVALIGHFSGVEDSPYDRNFADANNETILDGQIGQNYWEAVQYVVKADGILSSIVDGFTIRGSYYGAGVYLNETDVGIVNCKFKNNSYGIQASNYSYPDIHNCLFMDNSNSAVYSDTSEPDISYSILDGNDTTYYGLYLTNGSTSNTANSDFKNHNGSGIQGSYATVDIEDCKLSQNGAHGVEGSVLNLTSRRTVFENNGQNGIRLSSYSNLDIKNCVIRKSGYQGIYLTQNSGTEIVSNWIHNNGTDEYAYYYGGAGIYFENQIGIPKVWNDTIYDNYTYGIQSSEQGADPNIANCIISSNDSNDFYRENGSFNKVNYCLLQHPHTGIGNITGDPGFINPTNPNDLHIDASSPCNNAGNPYGDYSGETDIDDEDRVKYGRVDIGGDEYYYSLADFNGDGIVNFLDYALFADAWQTQNPGRSLDGNSDVDIYDLKLFCEDWLWKPAWDNGWMMSMGGGDSGLGLESISPAESALVLDVTKADSSGSDNLMLSTAAESMNTRPKRLAAKSDKFYAVNAFNTISALRKEESARRTSDGSYKSISAKQQKEKVEPVKIEPVKIEELIDWLDSIWLDGELKEAMTEAEYLEFRKAIEESSKEIW